MKRSHIFLFATPALALVGTVFLLFAYGTAFDPTVSNYFTAGNPLPVLAAVFLFLAIVCGAVGAFFAKKDPNSLTPPSVPSYAAVPAALGALCTAVWLLATGNGLLGVLILAASILFTLCFCMVAKLYGKLLLWLGFVAIAATIYYNACFYFDMTVEMNAPTKVLLQMAFLAAMLFITAECRLLLDRFDRLFIPILTVFCLVLCISAGLADFYLFFAKKGTGTIYLAAAPILLGIGITAAWRLFQMALPAKKTGEQLETTSETIPAAEAQTDSMVEPSDPPKKEDSDK